MNVGLATGLGIGLSILLCVPLYIYLNRKLKIQSIENKKEVDESNLIYINKLNTFIDSIIIYLENISSIDNKNLDPSVYSKLNTENKDFFNRKISEYTEDKLLKSFDHDNNIYNNLITISKKNISKLSKDIEEDIKNWDKIKVELNKSQEDNSNIEKYRYSERRNRGDN